MATGRRLAAIMFTDMVGSTALAQANEAEALRLRDEQEGIVRPVFASHRGREIKSMGDGYLVEFESALRAVQCAIEIQQRLHELNTRPGGTPLHLRIGIHLGDVEARGSDIFGDSVNIASRVEPLARPGGICLTEPVHGQVHNKLPNRLEKLPPQTLKGVQVPLDVYRVVLPWEDEESGASRTPSAGLAVLPFSNISPDPNDAYFADGLTEELITVLSQLGGLRVIARTSVMPYRSTSKGVSQIGAELRVSSLLEGSVRKSGNRLRVTAQLIDVASEGHVWAQTYDRELDDIFAVQSELARQVAEALKVELRATETARLESRPSVRTDSYLAYLKGITLLHGTLLANVDTELARQELERAISLDPTNAAAHAGLSDALRVLSWAEPKDREAKRAQSSVAARRAIELDPNLAEAHLSLGVMLWDEADFPGAEREMKRAVELNPSFSWAHWLLGAVLEDEGRLDEGFAHFLLAEAADPRWHLAVLFSARSLFWQGRFDEVLPRVERAEQLAPLDPWCHAFLADVLTVRGETERAVRELARAEELETVVDRRPGWRAWSYAIGGQLEKSREILRHEETLPEAHWPLWYLAEVYLRLGDIDNAFRLLERAADARQLPLQSIRFHPLLQPLRDDPRFPGLLKRVNLT
jgi:adenylate cyclase